MNELLLMVQKSQTTTVWMVLKPSKTLYLNGVNLPYQLVIAGFFPSTVLEIHPFSTKPGLWKLSSSRFYLEPGQSIHTWLFSGSTRQLFQPGLNSLVHRVSLLEGDKDWRFRSTERETTQQPTARWEPPRIHGTNGIFCYIKWLMCFW